MTVNVVVLGFRVGQACSQTLHFSTNRWWKEKYLHYRKRRGSFHPVRDERCGERSSKRSERSIFSKPISSHLHIERSTLRLNPCRRQSQRYYCANATEQTSLSCKHPHVPFSFFLLFCLCIKFNSIPRFSCGKFREKSLFLVYGCYLKMVMFYKYCMCKFWFLLLASPSFPSSHFVRLEGERVMLQHQSNSYFFIVLFVFPQFATAFRLIAPSSTTTIMRSWLRWSPRTTSSPSIHRLRQKAVRTVVSSTTNANDNNTVSPSFNFGLIADIQYVDADDATNFAGTTQRFYRHSFNTYKEALQYWQHEVKPHPQCALVLGDILDGKTAQMRYMILLHTYLACKGLIHTSFLMANSNLINIPTTTLSTQTTHNNPETKKNALDVFWMHRKTCLIRYIIALVSSPPYY